MSPARSAYSGQISDIDIRLKHSRCGPPGSVGEDQAYLLVVEDWERLVTRPKVEHPSVSTLKRTTATKDLSALEPGDKHHLIGLRDIKSLAVHLAVLELDALG